MKIPVISQAKNEDLEAVVQVCLVSGHHPAGLAQCAEELGSLQERAFYTRDVMDPLTPIKEKFGERSWYCVSFIEKPVDRCISGPTFGKLDCVCWCRKCICNG